MRCATLAFALLAACTPDQLESSVESAQDLRLHGKEILDNGDDPTVLGCLTTYTDTSCMEVFESIGDYCDSATHLKERTDPRTCNNDAHALALHDCRTVLDNTSARCVTYDGVCLPGSQVTGTKSARCEVLGPNPAPGANDTCVCPVAMGETVIANECPTLDAGCPAATCIVSANNTLVSRPCEYKTAGPKE